MKLPKPCEGCRKRVEELARLREAQESQIKAHVLDAERKQATELARWGERFDRLLRMAAKSAGITY